jgi:site-specific DNA-methyltransferase (adenine-specific)
LKIRSPRNRTLQVDEDEYRLFAVDILKISQSVNINEIENRLAIGDFLSIAPFLPSEFADLIIADPPYNLNKTFGELRFKKQSIEDYTEYVLSWLVPLVRLLKPNGSMYICSDWFTSTSIHLAASKLLEVQNRITWEREKGRGALQNWKNVSEDIWFLTKGKGYKFNVNAVKLKKRVIAPYKIYGKPKGWEKSSDGNFRLTHPSNLWADITVPYWSMPENTDHPTQKPEKLLAKLILASSNPNDMVFDPFIGSGTTAVVAQKLNRRYFGIDINETYLVWALKRLSRALSDKSIQGYANGVFWERNSSLK